jgi:hypothetical protein
MDSDSRGGFMTVGSKRRFAFPRIISGVLNLFDQSHLIDLTF